jgi:hypothetical protein
VTPSTTSPQSGLVKPSFTIVIPAQAATSAITRKPNFVSPGSLSVVITLTSVNGGAPNVSPTTVTTDINGTSGNSCTSGCTVYGPPSPPNVADSYTFETTAATGGYGAVLSIATLTFTPKAGQNNTETVTLAGIPYVVALNVPTLPANTQGQSATLGYTVKDASMSAISGPFADSNGAPLTIRVTDPDTLTYGTSLTGTNPGTGCTGSCVDLKSSTDTLTLDYGGQAENAVTFFVSATGTLNGGIAGSSNVFTPTLKPITYVSGPEVASAPEVDLFTTDSGSATGYSGTETFQELGFTNSPYNQSLSLEGAYACSTFASFTGSSDAFTATAIASPVAGSCMLTVADGLSDQTNTLPTFVVTYTTSSITGNAKHRTR